MSAMRRFLAVVVLAAAGGAAAAVDNKPVVSVLYFDNQSKNADLDVLRKGLADMIVTDLVAWDGVVVVEREKLEQVLGELKLQQTKSFDKATAQKVGRFIGAEYVIAGSMALAGEELRLDARISKVESGEVATTASVKDHKDKIFDLEQLLVEKLTAGIDAKLKGSGARKKAKAPSLEALLAYSRAVDLSDQGRLEEAQAAMAAVVAKSPTFLLARDKKESLLKSLKELEQRRKEIISGSALEVGRLLDKELAGAVKAGDVAALSRRVALREIKKRYLARVLKQSLSSRDSSTRAVKKGKEAEALKVMRAWAELQRQLIEDAGALKAATAFSSDVKDAALLEKVKESGFATELDVSTNLDVMQDELAEFVIAGRVTDGAWYTVTPPLGVLDPKEEQAALAALDKELDEALAKVPTASPEQRADLERRVMDAAGTKGRYLELLERDEDAAVAYQRALDAFPTSSSAGRLEDRIKVIAGAQHEHERSVRERWAKALTTCEDMDLRVGMGVVSRRFRRQGMAAIEAFAAEMEKACAGIPRAASGMAYTYRSLADTASTHEDCELAKKMYLKSYASGEGIGSLQAYMKNEPWCDYQFVEGKVPTKVRVTRVSAGSRHPDGALIADAITDVLREELAARGIAIEQGGSHHGGTWGLYVTVEYDGGEATVNAKLTKFGDEPDTVFTGTSQKGTLSLTALLEPMLKVMRTGAEPGPRKPSTSVPVRLLIDYGRAVDLLDDRKWDEAQKAFDELAKKNPSFRLARVGSWMANAQQEPYR